MDSVPKEIAIHIFSFLPEKDVVRFLQLNTRFRNIIKQNKHYLKYPKIYLQLSCESYKDPKKNKRKQYLYVAINRGNQLIIDCSDTNAVTLKDWGDPDENSFNKKFFQPYFKSDFITTIFPYFRLDTMKPRNIWTLLIDVCCNKNIQEKQSLLSFFDFIFEKADVDMEYYIENPKWLEILTQSLRRNNTVIHSIQMRGGNPDIPEWIDIFYVIAGQKLRRRKRRAIIVLLDIMSMWSNLQKLNDISMGFDETTFLICASQTAATMENIAKEWRLLNFPALFFNIHFFTKLPERYTLPLEKCPSIFEHYIVKDRNPKEFLNFSDLKKFSSIELEERKSGNVLLFERKDGYKWTPLRETHSLYSVKVYVTVSLK